MDTKDVYQIRRAGVMGWPVDHSLSPVVHGYWLEKFKVRGEYVKIPVSPDGFEQKLRNLKADGFVGVNITVPHKEAALAAVDNAHPLASRIGAVNTVVVFEDESLYGFNTDGFGFLENLKAGDNHFDPAGGPAVILGAGGAARAVVAALLDAGAPQVRILNRTRERAEEVADALREVGSGEIVVGDWNTRADYLDGAHLLANTTTLGMKGQHPLDLDLSHLPKTALVNDIVYVPLMTDLLSRAEARGNPIVDGLGMLLHQARPGFESWFGPMPDVTPDLRKKVLAAAGLKE